MDVYSAIRELNAAQAKLDAAIGSQSYVQPWTYCGDVNIENGGIAIRVDRASLFADVVVCTNLGSAIGQDDCVLFESATVPLGGSLRDRQRIRSALASFGWKASTLLEFSRNNRAAEIVRALWVYGYRDTTTDRVIRYAGDAPADNEDYADCTRYMAEDEAVSDPAALVERFMEELN